MKCRFWVLLMLITVGSTGFADTFLIIAQETRNGEAYPHPSVIDWDQRGQRLARELLRLWEKNAHQL